jgi:hypothetical protein
MISANMSQSLNHGDSVCYDVREACSIGTHSRQHPENTSAVLTASQLTELSSGRQVYSPAHLAEVLVMIAAE